MDELGKSPTLNGHLVNFRTAPPVTPTLPDKNFCNGSSDKVTTSLKLKLVRN